MSKNHELFCSYDVLKNDNEKDIHMKYINFNLVKISLIAALLALNTACSTTGSNQAAAQTTGTNDVSKTAATGKELPTQERAFVDAINGSNKKSIIAQFGEPAKADDVKIKGSNKIVASIWQYHYINTDVDGTYYQTTELDFINNKVVQVVFLNNDGSEPEAGSQSYQVPEAAK